MTRLEIDPARRQVFVIGNEAADVDSLVSAYVMAQLLDTTEVQGVALAQIPREEFRLRGDALALFAQSGSDVAVDGCPLGLYFWDEVPWDDVQAVEERSIILTDHNRMAPKVATIFDGRVARVLDHHANTHSYPDAEVELDENLGSACTLVAEQFISKCPDVPSPIGKLLLGVIILDCRNFHPKDGRGTPRDQAAVDSLAAFLPEAGAAQWYKELWDARCDVSHLSVRELLMLDLKALRHVEGQNVAFCSLLDTLGGCQSRAGGTPDDLIAQVREFGAEKGYDLVVCLFSRDDTGRKAVAFVSTSPADEPSEAPPSSTAGVCAELVARVRAAPEGLSQELSGNPLFATQGILDEGFGLELAEDFAPLPVFTMRGVITRKTLLPCAMGPSIAS